MREGFSVLAVVWLSILSSCPLITATYGSFKTEPLISPETFTIHRIPQNKSLLAPGYLFIDPLNGNWGWGPQIYTQEGELVWYGNRTASWRVQDFHVCDFLGGKGDHLCWHEARERDGPFPVGRKAVADNTYKTTEHKFTTALKGSFPNTHEFRFTPGGQSFLETIYQPVQMDLTPYFGPERGWVFDGCFAEVNASTSDIIFKWCSLDHMPIWETNLFMYDAKQLNKSSKLAGFGTYKSPWDFFHMNSIDKNSEGDYLISSRYYDQITKISGPDSLSGTKPGTILWRLGGKGGDFKMNFKFTRQHAARYISTEREHTLISLFANNWDGRTAPSAGLSEGQIIRISNITGNMHARLETAFPHPEGVLVGAQGNLQMLPNGNALVDWGTLHKITEFSSKGKVLYHADFNYHSYRAFKTPWVGKPHWPPNVVAYAKTCQSSSLNVYVSWNGATEVTHWQLYNAPTRLGPWIPIGMFPRTGFETRIDLSSNGGALKFLNKFDFARFVYVEGLDSSGDVLGQASTATFVPCRRTRLGNKCNDKGCETPAGFTYQTKDSCANVCGRPWLPSVAAVFLICLLLETIESFYRRLLDEAIDNVYDAHDRRAGLHTYLQQV